MYLVFDIGGSSTKICLFDKKGKIEAKNQIKANKSYRGFLDDLLEVYRFYCKDYHIDKISFSSPGIIDKVKKRSSGLTALGYLDRDFVGDFSKLTGFNKDKIYIENDGNCGGLGELFFDKTIKNFVYLVVGSGIGGALVLDRKIYRGFSNKAGEYGYMLSLNNKENLSSLATMPNVVRRLKKEKNTDLGSIEIFNRYRQGEEPYYSYVDKAINELVKAMYNLQYAIDPEVFIIGGAISSDKRYINKLREKAQIGDFKSAKLNIRAAKFFNDNNLYGALYNAVGENFD